ncbi:hypothetical protein DOTSEDRAFT_27787 [Dothistroma septosporum NZE10]|uniref:Suppressor of anucleate metulae protein B n=1 Tax=Dothistroma septosporum (strain NZE10 / CBS 128990) TaxID=675120 RepID=N1PCR5_DOTSN|nr:hypothetical protein DOTSEDRAFT_27787 [Dothistroma septosporum NZE10]
MPSGSFRTGQTGVMVVFNSVLNEMTTEGGQHMGQMPPMQDGILLGCDGRDDPQIPLPLTMQLGLPIQYSVHDDLSLLFPKGHVFKDNMLLRLLSLDVDPNSDSFGSYTHTATRNMTLSRTDFQTLNSKDVEAIIAYVRLVLRDIRAVSCVDRSSIQYREAYEKAVGASFLANPVDFAGFRDLYKKGPVCQACGMPQGWRDVVEMLACVQCQEGVYCSETCHSRKCPGAN